MPTTTQQKTDVLNYISKKKNWLNLKQKKKCEKREGELLGIVTECVLQNKTKVALFFELKRETILHFLL